MDSHALQYCDYLHEPCSVAMIEIIHGCWIGEYIMYKKHSHPIIFDGIHQSKSPIHIVHSTMSSNAITCLKLMESICKTSKSNLISQT